MLNVSCCIVCNMLKDFTMILRGDKDDGGDDGDYDDYDDDDDDDKFILTHYFKYSRHGCDKTKSD